VEDRYAVAVSVDAVEHQAMQMNIQIGRRAEALDERDHAGIGSAKFKARALDQKAGNDAVDHVQERREQLRLRGRGFDSHRLWE